MKDYQGTTTNGEMKMLPYVNIIMSITDRPENLVNTLDAWSLIDYPNFDFTVIDNGSGNRELEYICYQYEEELEVDFFREPKAQNVNRIWNKYAKRGFGEYVIFAMMDEIISHKDIVQKMVACSDVARVSIFTYFLSLHESLKLDEFDWKNDPTVIPKPATFQTTAGLISHITGNYRKNWEWFGWFRDNERGSWWVDQDLHLREKCLGEKYYCKTPSDVYCLHQYHRSSFDGEESGFVYKTERQARLLDPAEKELA